MGPVSQSANKAEEYYYEKDPFYAPEGKGENSQWRGGGLKELGLKEGQPIKGNEFVNIIHGRDLEGNQQVRPSYGDREGRTEHRAGVDFSFDDPKGISIAEHVLGYKVDEIKAARTQALDKVLSVIDKEYIFYRETRNGATQSVHAPGQGIIAVYQHSLSRMNDPQSHNHVLICNMVNTPHGCRALDNTAIYRDQKYLTAVYHAEMAAALSKKGFSIENRGKGLYEIGGINKGVIEQFSKRSGLIREKEAELKANKVLPYANDAQINRIATLETRPVKDQSITQQEARRSWDNQLIHECNISKDHLIDEIRKACALDQKIKTGKDSMQAKEYVEIAVIDRTARESTFTREEIVKDALALSIGKFAEKEISAAFQDMEKNAAVQILNPEKRVYSTSEMIQTEQRILDNLKSGQGQMQPVMTIGEANKFISEYQERNEMILTKGQRELFVNVMTSTNRFILSQGDAGTGKTTVFKSIVQAAASKGIEVTGFSKTGKAVQEFKDATETNAYTIDSFLLRRENIPSEEGRITSSRENETRIYNAIRVIDEASMLGSRQTLAMLETALNDNKRMVVLGDFKQLQSLDAGRIFQDAQEKGQINVVRLSENLRQQTNFAKELIETVKYKDFDMAQKILEENGKIYELEDRRERLETAKGLYFAMGGREAGTHIITQINLDRKAFNEMIRHDLKAQGKLTDSKIFQIREAINLSTHDKRFAHNFLEGNIVIAQKGIPGMRAGTEAQIKSVDTSKGILQLTAVDGKQLNIQAAQYGNRLHVFQPTEKEFAVGDSIAFTKNNSSLNVQNGLTGIIKGIDENLRISIETKGGRIVNIDSQQYQYMDHAYASTDFKSQGASYKNVIFIGEAERANSNEFYVVVSRTKEDFHMIINNKEEYFDKAKLEQEKTSTLDYTHSIYSPDEHQKTADEVVVSGITEGIKVSERLDNAEKGINVGDMRIENDFYVASEKDTNHEHTLIQEEISITK